MPLFGDPDISKLEAKQDVKRLTKALENISTRSAAAGALIRIGAPSVKPLMDIFKRDPKTIPVVLVGTIMQVVVAIGQPAVEPLIALLDDGNPSVREFSAGLLKQIGGERSKAALEKGKG